MSTPRGLQQITLLRVQRHAPARPPCFESHEDWIEWLAWCESSGDPALPVFVSGVDDSGEISPDHKRRKFNTGLNFCNDCARGAFMARMEREGRCRPAWLKQDEARLGMSLDLGADAPVISFANGARVGEAEDTAA